jgi:hypothetical protein
MKLFEKMRRQKLLSTTLMLFTLSLGIVIGTLLNTGVHAQRGQSAAPMRLRLRFQGVGGGQ